MNVEHCVREGLGQDRIVEPKVVTTSMTAVPPLVSIIVINYRTRELTLECLRSVARETKSVSYEILLVDNASNDGLIDVVAQEMPDVRRLPLAENVGFARGNNMAAEQARGKYLLLLNSDTLVLDGAIDRLLAFAGERPAAQIWGGRTLSGRWQAGPWLVLAPHDAVERALPHLRPGGSFSEQQAVQRRGLWRLGSVHGARGRHRDGLLPAH